MRILMISTILAASLSMGGCMQSDTSKGAALGATTGAIVGSLSGNWGQGALIGAGVGAVGGYISDQHKK
jgi:hypothetical protein